MKNTIDLFGASNSNTEIYRTASTKAAVMLEEMLIRFIEKEDASTTNNSPAQQLYSRVISVMSKHCEEDFSVEDIARECNISASNMKRIYHH